MDKSTNMMKKFVEIKVDVNRIVKKEESSNCNIFEDNSLVFDESFATPT